MVVFSLIAGLLLSQGFTGERDLFLRVRGDKVLDGSGNPVILRGFNVAFKDFQGLLGEKDIRNISESGANSIRLVLDYRHLESGPFLFNNSSLTILDSVLNWCEKYRVYVILDMHLAPGIQNPHDFVVHRERSYDFWKKKEFQKRIMAHIDRDALIKRLRYALNFRSRHGVPLYVGEFTAHANPAGESVFRYLGDLLGIMRDEGLHWSYWTYYSEYPGIGIHTGNHPRLARPEELDILRKNMKSL